MVRLTSGSRGEAIAAYSHIVRTADIPRQAAPYWDLVEHPAERIDKYRRESTEGSILYPMLALWADARGQQQVINEIAAFKKRS